MKIEMLYSGFIFLAALLLPLSNPAQAQSSLALSSATVLPGGTTALNLSLASQTSAQPAAVQWTIGYPATGVANLTVAAGPALSAAGKTLSCNSGASSYTCVAWGLNSSGITDGIVAIVSVTMSGSTDAPFTLSNSLGSSPAGDAIAVTGTGGTVTVDPLLTITSIACSPLALAPSTSSNCTVSLSGSGGGTIGLSSSSTNLTVPPSVTIPPGSVSGTFLATAKTFAADQNATVTVTLNGLSKPVTFSLVATPVTLSSFQCATASLASNASTTCTVTLSSSTASSTVVTLANSAATVLTVPSSVTVAASATSATFTASTGELLSDQTVTVTATLNGASKPVTFSLAATPVTLSTLQCAAASLASNASTICTVTLSTSTASSTLVAISNSSSSVLTVPTSVSVAPNANTATFTASAGALLSDQAATVTATLNGSSKTATVALVAPLVVSGTSASAITASGATITWTTNKASDSQLAYGATPAYGSLSVLDSTPVTSHKVNLTGLAPSTIYHYKVMSGNIQSTMAESGDFTLTTAAATGPQILLQLHSDASEVTGVTNGSIVTPSIAPPGFTGNIVVTAGGSVNFAPAQTGNGVYFLKCCQNSTNAYYKFSGTTVGSVFNLNQGQITFYLKSRQSFAQRRASASSYRQAFDVRDANNHLFGFITQATSGYLMFGYTIAGASTNYVAPIGTEEALFGNGTILKVSMTWDGSVAKLFLNDKLAQQSPYTPPTPNWSAASNFDLGAYEYQTVGGYDSNDDIIDEFTVTGPARSAAPGMPTTLITSRTELEAAIRPVIERLQNGANEAAPAACSPEAVATLIGHFLPEDAVPVSDRSGHATSLAGARVLINGSYSPVLYASSDRVDFLCPAVPPATDLSIAVETAAGLSNGMETRVEEASPGIFAPVVLAAGPGGTVSIRATGMTWLAKFPTVRPYVRIGTQYVPIESITQDSQDSGVSTLTIKLPFNISGDSAPIVIEVVQTDGRSVASNPAAIPVEPCERPESQACIGQ